MSFVNMMSNDVWSSADVDNKVQALIRSRFSENDELKAARLARGASPSVEDQAFVAAVDGWIAECVAEGRQARQDSALLEQALQVEAAQRRLAQYRLADGKPAVTEEREVLGEDGLPVLDEDGNVVTETVELEPAIPPITEFILDEEGNPTEEPNQEWQRAVEDDAQRAEAQAVVDAASAEALALVEQRKS